MHALYGPVLEESTNGLLVKPSSDYDPLARDDSGEAKILRAERRKMLHGSAHESMGNPAGQPSVVDFEDLIWDSPPAEGVQVPRRARAGLHAAIDDERKMSADIADAWDRCQLREGELLQRPAEFTNPSLGAGNSADTLMLGEDATDMDDELVEASCDSSSL